jgi:hypothetical protein
MTIPFMMNTIIDSVVFCVAFFLNGDWFMQRGQTPLLSIVLLLLIINALNTQHDLTLVLAHPVNQGEACL